MTNMIPGGIWPPHEAFYIESMLHSTQAALRAAEEVRGALNAGSKCAPSSPEWHEYAFTIINGVQALIAHVAAVSRYFWPARNKEPHLSRAARLKTSLGVTESSPLRNRDLRNHLEHLDERLDEFCIRLTAGVILPTYVGPQGREVEAPTYLFCAYYTDVGIFEIFGQRFKVQEVLDEIRAVHDRLMHYAEHGGRLCNVEA